MNRIVLLLLYLSSTAVHAQLSSLNDEFDDAATLSNWSRINDTEGWEADQIESMDINTSSAGELVMVPYTCGWFDDRRGPLTYKLVNSRYFSFTTSVTASSRDGSGIPSSTYSLAGIMIRTPKSFPNGAATDWVPGEENYVFLSCGNGDQNGPFTEGNPAPPHFEVKTTIDSDSELQVSGIASLTDVIIKLVRIDDVILVLYRLPGEDFVVHRRFHRPDFPDEVQVGFVTYTDWPGMNGIPTVTYNSMVVTESENPDVNPDLRARFKYARFLDESVPAELTGLNFLTEVTDEQIVELFGTNETNQGPLSLFGYSGINTYPNPADYQLFVTISESNPELFLTDLMGQTIELKGIIQKGDEYRVALPPLSAGTYILHINTAMHSYRSKVFIQPGSE